MVKNAYDIPNKIEYPLVVVTELLNSENTKYSTNDGEQVTNLTYQIDVYCQNTKIINDNILNAIDSAKLLGTKISKLLGGERYKMARVGQEILQSLSADNTVKRHTQRYECCLELKTNTLYRKRHKTNNKFCIYTYTRNKRNSRNQPRTINTRNYNTSRDRI